MTGADRSRRALTLDRVTVTGEPAEAVGRGAAAAPTTVVDDVTLRVAVGECVGLIGDREPATAALIRVAAGVTRPRSGSVSTGDREVGRLSLQAVLRGAPRSVQPDSTVERHVAWLDAGLPTADVVERRARTVEVLTVVGIDPEGVDAPIAGLPTVDQRRVAIARAVAAAPDVLIVEDLTAGLGPTARGQLLDVLVDVHRALVPTMLVTDPDPAFVAGVSDRLAILHEARLVESGRTVDVIGAPAHPYTHALFAALPVPRPRTPPVDRPRPPARLPGATPPPGCRFHPRCWLADDRCRRERPALEPVPRHDPDHEAACFHALS